MFARLFGSKNRNEEVVDALYGRIVAAARQERFYADWQVPDTPIGRFEMLSLHMFLALRRMGGSDAALAGVAQELTDEFFKDVDHSLRELGIGDMGVPKRMKKLARMFYGRTASYDEAIAAGSRDMLAAALRRNVRPEADAWPQAGALAAYALVATEDLAGQPDARLLQGDIAFPAPSAAEAA